MTIAEINILHEKAKTRKDGVYSFRGNLWVVRGGNFVAYSDQYGRCFARMGSFNAVIGTVDRHERKEKLTEWLKKQ